MSVASGGLWFPYTSLNDPDTTAQFNVDRAEGLYLYNKEGQKVLDGIASWWCCHHGHRHPHLMKALKNQADKLVHVSLAGLTHDLAEELASKLQKLTQLEAIFYSDNGSTAIEVALKICWQRRQLQGHKNPGFVIGFEQGYHGDTLACMAVGKSDFHQSYDNYFHHVKHVPSPDNAEICLKELKRILKEEGELCSAVIIEPLLQAAGGMKVHSTDTLKQIHLLCQQFNVPLIADEIAVGLGRCAATWACEKAGFVPDILCTSKGLTGGMLPLAATCVSARIAKEFNYTEGVTGQTLNHGHTYTGHALACAVALASLELLEEKDFLPHCRDIEEMLCNELPQFATELPMASTRSMGTVGIVELDNSTVPSLTSYYRAMIKKGYYLRPLDNIAYFWPPLTITVDAYKNMLDCSRETLKEIYSTHHV